MRFFLFIFAIGLTGCSTVYEKTAVKSWDLMANGKALEAVQVYDKEVTSDKEKLLKLMDQGILFRAAGDFKASNEKFFAAAKIIELNGYFSLGESVLTTLTNEKQSVYQGEDFEKVLVHLYLGLNFLSLNQFESALVETRKVNEIIYKMVSQAKRPYELNSFAQYVGALLFENDRDLNDAIVSYRQALKTSPELKPFVRMDLFRLFRVMGFTDEFLELKKQMSESEVQWGEEILAGKYGSVVLLLESGKSPQKYSTREKHQVSGKDGTLNDVLLPVPVYKRRRYDIRGANVTVGEKTVSTVMFNDIEDTAIRHLQDRMGREIAKALLTAGVKAGIATGIGKAADSAELGLLVGLALFAMSEADTRSWLLLPGQLQIAKLYLPAGKYNVKVSYFNMYGRVLREENIPDVVVKPTRASLIQKRAYE